MGYHQSYKVGFGSISITKIPAKKAHAHLKLLSTVQEEADEEKLLAHVVHLKLQGQ